ncbi:MAG: hypothetical protein H3C27_08985 [Opitutaceae bacterium]|nr:hypothetical protein [Opitutaceae bacterium]
MTHHALNLLPKLRITAPDYGRHRALLDVLIKSQPHLRVNLHPLREEVDRAGGFAPDPMRAWEATDSTPAKGLGASGAVAGRMTLLTPDGMAIIGLPWVSRPVARRQSPVFHHSA